MRSATSAPYRQRLALAAALTLALLAAFTLPPRAGAAALFYIRGGGNGHGVGMSQYGAYGYALHGKNYRWILAHYFEGTALGQADPRQRVRVLLGSGRVAFSGASAAGGKALNPSDVYTVGANADGSLTLLTEAGRKVAHFTTPFSATGPGPLMLVSPSPSPSPSAGAYNGALEFRPNGSGGVETINVTALDDYVRGVVAAEMPSSWAPAALEAQTVAARTYAITTDAGGSVFGLYADTRSQMYGGVGAETPATDAAVAATSGQVVTYHGLAVVTYFFSSSGGHTENVENAWPGAAPEPWLRGVPDPFDGSGGDPYHRWSYVLTPAKARAKLGALVKGRLIGIQVTAHGASPRILTARVVGTGGRTTVSGLQLQRAFGLLTTDASFTTISTFSGALVAPPRRTRIAPWRSGGARPRAVIALAPLLHDGVSSTLGMHGAVFPGRARVAIAVQQATASGWQTVARIRTRAGGVYDTALVHPGTYRIVYQGLNGPTVKVRSG